MKCVEFRPAQTDAVLNLYTSVFAAAEDTEEGAVIGRLVGELIATTADADIVGFLAVPELVADGRDAAAGETSLAGCIFFSRLKLSNAQPAFLLSPVAVATELHGRGVGQQLIRHGIDAMRGRGVELLFTYGDPAFYGKVGFQPISEDFIRAPFTLSQPQGWLAQSLTGTPLRPIDGPTRCVSAFGDPSYW